jgi:hypothetical protein
MRTATNTTGNGDPGPLTLGRSTKKRRSTVAEADIAKAVQKRRFDGSSELQISSIGYCE